MLCGWNPGNMKGFSRGKNVHLISAKHRSLVLYAQHLAQVSKCGTGMLRPSSHPEQTHVQTRAV